jgi:hypothetical protein
VLKKDSIVQHVNFSMEIVESIMVKDLTLPPKETVNVSLIVNPIPKLLTKKNLLKKNPLLLPVNPMPTELKKMLTVPHVHYSPIMIMEVKVAVLITEKEMIQPLLETANVSFIVKLSKLLKKK